MSINPIRTQSSRRGAVAILSAIVLTAAALTAARRADAVTAVTVTVQMASGTATGSYATGFCATPATTVALSMTCSDGSSQHVTFFTAAATNTVVLAPGTYNTGVLGPPPSYAAGGAGTVTIPVAATATCTFSMTEAPACAQGSTPPPPAPTGIVLLRNIDPTASLASAWCGTGTAAVLGSTSCADGTDAHVDLLAPGASATRRLDVTWWNVAVATLNPLAIIHESQIRGIGENIVVECLLATTGVDCHYYDGNGDGVPDWQQTTIANVVTPNDGAVVSVGTTGTGVTISDATASEIPSDVPVPPTPMPAGLIGFTVHLPDGATSADVTVTLPPGTAASKYFKLRSGSWVDFTNHVTFSRDHVTLHLVDNDAFDTDPAVGVIGDPGGPALAEPTTVTVATCTGTRALAAAKSTSIASDGLPAGITTANAPVTLSAKGTYVAGTKDSPAVGSCTLDDPADVTGTHAITKWGLKVDSRAVDCRKDGDRTERPLTGKLTYSLAGGYRIDAQVTLSRFDPRGHGPDTIGLKGIVTKGVAAGADLSGELWWLPVVKDRTQTADWMGIPSPYDSAVYPGYRADVDALTACIDATGATAADVRSVLFGDGASPIYGSIADGVTLSFDL